MKKYLVHFILLASITIFNLNCENSINESIWTGEWATIDNKSDPQVVVLYKKDNTYYLKFINNKKKLLFTYDNTSHTFNAAVKDTVIFNYYDIDFFDKKTFKLNESHLTPQGETVYKETKFHKIK